MGQPVVGARVQAVVRLKKWAGPYYEVPAGRPDESDDRGQFRLHSLPPGQYVVAVGVESPPAPEAQREATGYVRTDHPGTTSLTDAQAIAVQAGQEQLASVSM